MDDCFARRLIHHPHQGFGVQQIHHTQPSGIYRLAVPARQIVDNNDVVAGIKELERCI
jgi:hypothetical protein